MNIKSVYYQVFYKNNDTGKFIKVKNPFLYWMADPFPVIYKKKRYIFAEKAGIFSGHGQIFYCCLDDSKIKWRRAIKTKFHMSFPNVFMHDGEYFMVPETYQDGCVALYKCDLFPDKWHKFQTLKDNIKKPVDTIIFRDKIFTYCDETKKLYIYDVNSKYEDIFDDNNSGLRAAGKIIFFNGEHYYISQNCSRIYGENLIVNKIIDNGNIEIKKICEYLPSNFIDTTIERKEVIGCHTFNKIDDFEVIDIIYNKFTFVGFISKIVNKIISYCKKATSSK